MRNPLELLISAMAATLVVAAIVVSAPVVAAESRASLADRVAKLEAGQQNDAQRQATVDLLNRIDSLQAEVQSLRGQVEQQNHEIETLKKLIKDQYVDLDSRITRIESSGGNSANASPAANNAPADAGQPDIQLSSPGAPHDGRGSGPDFGPGPGASSTNPAASQPPATVVPTTPGPAGVDEKASYDDAFAALRQQRYADSARRFNTFLQKYPNSELTPNALYWLGESYYVTQNYQVALESFQDLLSKYPNSGKAPDALLKVGYCQFELKQTAAAQRTLSEVARRYPDTTVGRLAEGRLRALRIDGQR